jgi:hypothetical protein
LFRKAALTNWRNATINALKCDVVADAMSDKRHATRITADQPKQLFVRTRTALPTLLWEKAADKIRLGYNIHLIGEKATGHRRIPESLAARDGK